MNIDFSDVIKVLADEYINVFVVDPEHDTGSIIKQKGYVPAGIINYPHSFSYSQMIQSYAAKRVYHEDREYFLKFLMVDEIIKYFSEDNTKLEINYRIHTDEDIHHCIVLYTRVSPPDEPLKLIVAVRDADSVINIHSRQRLERDLAYQKQLMDAVMHAKRANQAKTEFLRRMSHDVRTPINGIVGMLDIADRFKDDYERQQECRTKIRKATKILLELVNDVMDMSKLESDNVVLENIPFNILEVSKDIYEVVLKQAAERDIEIIQHECGIKHPYLIGSPVHFKRIIMNLVTNAIKYNKDHGQIYVTCRELASNNNFAAIEFKCRDTGIGMSEDFQKHLFEPFAQENALVRTQFAGTGLGLSITKSLVDKMGGTITFESVQGEGTTFDVIISFKIDESDGAKDKAANHDEKYSVQGMKIILAEDNELNMEIAKFLLETEGACVIEAKNGQEVIDVFKDSQVGEVDAILMDIMMPIKDGYQATREIRGMDREDAETIPIIAMTANAFIEDKIAAAEAGMTDHISKPIDTRLVLKTLSNINKEKL